MTNLKTYINCRFWNWAFAFFLTVLTAGRLIWGLFIVIDTVDAGGDEHFELLKGYLTSKHGYNTGVPWNDQPPFHTLLISLLFIIFDGSLNAVRTFALFPTIFLFLWLHQGLKSIKNPICFALACWMLVSAPSTMMLYFTTMLEVPAFCLALIGSRLMLEPGGRSKAGVAGLLWGLAIATKLTCLLLAPALVCCYSLTLARVRFDYKTLKAKLQFLSVFLLAVVTVVLFMSLAFRNSDFDSLWRSHSVASNGSEARLHVFDPVKYLSSTIGIALLVSFFIPKKFNHVMSHSFFELCWFVVAFIVHCVHVPYWTYYNIHLNIPAVIIIVRSCNSVAVAIPAIISRDSGLDRSLPSVIYAAMALVLAVPCILPALEQFDDLGRRKKISESRIVAEIRNGVPANGVLFSSSDMLNVVCDRTSIPYVAIRPAKRFWSGAITWENVWSTVIESKPDCIVWHSAAELPENVRTFLHVNYTMKCEESGETMWLAKIVQTFLKTDQLQKDW